MNYNSNVAFVSVMAGAGGEDAKDWAQMLLRMYNRYAVRRGWKTAAGQPVKNQDLWMRLDAAARPHTVRWKWVKGHAGHVENERVDKLARAEADLRQVLDLDVLAQLLEPLGVWLFGPGADRAHLLRHR